MTALILALVMAQCLPGCAAGSDTEQTYPALSVMPSPNSAILSTKAGNIVGTSQTENWNLSMLYG